MYKLAVAATLALVSSAHADSVLKFKRVSLRLVGPPAPWEAPVTDEDSGHFRMKGGSASAFIDIEKCKDRRSHRRSRTTMRAWITIASFAPCFSRHLPGR
jgi:hypothetical protein